MISRIRIFESKMAAIGIDMSKTLSVNVNGIYKYVGSF